MVGIFFYVEKTAKQKRKISISKPLDVLDKLKDRLLPVVLLVFALLIISFPTYYLDSAKKGLALFASSVLPAVFPFAFLSSLFAKTSIIDDISKSFQTPIRKLFGVSKHGAYVLFSSLICGYPAGAATTLELYSLGLITEKEAKDFVPFSSTASPVYILATVGGALFCDVQIGLIVLCSHYVATLLNGILWRIINKSSKRYEASLNNGAKVCMVAPAPAHTRVRAQNYNNENLVGDAVVKATSTMLVVGGYIVLFGLVVDTINLLPFFGDLPPALKSLTYSLIEMSRGVVEARNIHFKPLAIALSSFSVTFGGICVNIQNFHFLSQCKCSAKDLFLPKISQGILAFFVAFIFSIIIFNIFGIKG